MCPWELSVYDVDTHPPISKTASAMLLCGDPLKALAQAPGPEERSPDSARADGRTRARGRPWSTYPNCLRRFALQS